MIKLRESDLLSCCGSSAWVREMASHSFPNVKEVFATGDSIWWSLGPADWIEAFGTHSRIGERGNQTLPHASEATWAELRELQLKYEDKFGFAFVVSASGRSVHSILEDLKGRIENKPETEIKVAALQQLEITHSRLKRILAP